MEANNLTLVCRGCLEPSIKTYPLVGNVLNLDVNIATMLEYCLCRKVDSNEKLPQIVCLSCFKSIRLAYYYLKQYNETQEKLYNSLKVCKDQQPPIKDEYNEAISKEHYSKDTQCFEYIDYDIKSYDDSVKNDIDQDEIEDQMRFEGAHQVETFEEGFNDDKSIIENLVSGETKFLEFSYVADDEPVEEKSPRSPLNHDSSSEMKLVPPKNNIVQLKNDPFLSIIYKCPLCPEEFGQYYKFHKHVFSHSVNSLVCTRCPTKAELTLDEFFIHYKQTHKYQCYICNKTLSSSYGFQYHMKHHENIKKFNCPVEGCEKSFLLSNLLRKHLRLHSGTSSYPCELCNAVFKSDCALNYHKKTHKGSRDHLCTQCGKAFYQAVHLKDHMNRHVGHKRFTCHICGLSAITNSQLTKHIAICTRKNRKINKI